MTYPQNPQYDPSYDSNLTPAPKKKSKKGLWLGLGGGVLGLLLCCGVGSALISNGTEGKVNLPTPGAAAPTTVKPADPDTTAPEPALPAAEPTSDTFNLKLGTTITVSADDGSEMEVMVKRNAKYPKPRTAACKAYMPKPDGGYYLIFDVTMKVTKGTGSINPLYFTYVGTDGSTDEGVGGLFSGCGDALDSGNEMRAGTKRSGQLVFESASTKGAVEFGGDFFGGTQASWKVG